MVRYKEYNPKECDCVIRALSKATNKNYSEVKNELMSLALNEGHNDYTDIEIFEKYMNNIGIKKIDEKFDDKQIKDLDFSNGKYVVFCWNKDDFYHLVTIIDNILYDKKQDTLDLYPISIYKDKNLL